MNPVVTRRRARSRAIPTRSGPSFSSVTSGHSIPRKPIQLRSTGRLRSTSGSPRERCARTDLPGTGGWRRSRSRRIDATARSTRTSRTRPSSFSAASRSPGIGRSGGAAKPVRRRASHIGCSASGRAERLGHHPLDLETGQPLSDASRTSGVRAASAQDRSRVLCLGVVVMCSTSIRRQCLTSPRPSRQVALFHADELARVRVRTFRRELAPARLRAFPGGCSRPPFAASSSSESRFTPRRASSVSTRGSILLIRERQDSDSLASSIASRSQQPSLGRLRGPGAVTTAAPRAGLGRSPTLSSPTRKS